MPREPGCVWGRRPVLASSFRLSPWLSSGPQGAWKSQNCAPEVLQRLLLYHTGLAEGMQHLRRGDFFGKHLDKARICAAHVLALCGFFVWSRRRLCKKEERRSRKGNADVRGQVPFSKAGFFESPLKATRRGDPETRGCRPAHRGRTALGCIQIPAKSRFSRRPTGRGRARQSSARSCPEKTH